MKVIVKELRETRICIKLIRRKEMIKPVSRLDSLFKECEELIAVVAKSIDTAKKNIAKSK
jgi:four helix bundle protein